MSGENDEAERARRRKQREKLINALGDWGIDPDEILDEFDELVDDALKELEPLAEKLTAFVKKVRVKKKTKG